MGRSDFWLSLTANVSGGSVAAKLYMNENSAPAVEMLLPSRAAIEAEVGAALEWNPHPDKKHKTIRLKHPVQLSDRDSWPSTIEWLVRNTVAMRAAFSPRIADFEL